MKNNKEVFRLKGPLTLKRNKTYSIIDVAFMVCLIASMIFMA